MLKKAWVTQTDVWHKFWLDCDSVAPSSTWPQTSPTIAIKVDFRTSSSRGTWIESNQKLTTTFECLHFSAGGGGLCEDEERILVSQPCGHYQQRWVQTWRSNIKHGTVRRIFWKHLKIKAVIKQRAHRDHSNDTTQFTKPCQNLYQGLGLSRLILIHSKGFGRAQPK